MMRSSSMSCIDCGYLLEPTGGPHCPECGRAFDGADAATFRRVLEDPVEVVKRTELSRAQTLRLGLEGAGIPAFVIPMTDGVIGYMNWYSGRVMVERPDEDAARAELERLERIVDEAAMPDPHASPWDCPACGETIEPQFAACWSCGVERG